MTYDWATADRPLAARCGSFLRPIFDVVERSNKNKCSKSVTNVTRQRMQTVLTMTLPIENRGGNKTTTANGTAHFPCVVTPEHLRQHRSPDSGPHARRPCPHA